MSYNMVKRLMFLTYESPLPAHSGGALRTLGLLKELSRTFKIDVVVLSRQPLSNKQIAVLTEYSDSLVRVPLRCISLQDKIDVIRCMVRYTMPYHCAIIEVSFRKCSKKLRRIHSYPSVIFTNVGHWGVLVRKKKSPNWILNQCDADVEFWRVYASQATNYLAKIAALINWWFADKHFRKIYPRVGRIVSVCKEDRQLTLDLCHQAQVDVIENGVDCSYYVPDRKTCIGPPRILFTGTSAPRNMTALHLFVHNVFPLIQKELPETELLVGGDFHTRAQAEFNNYNNIHFTGCVDDMRPLFNQSDVYIAPFKETHGSKLKIAEAMAMGMCIVSTPEGIRGFPLVDGESVFIARSSKQFAEHVARLLRDSVQREKTGTLARKVALSTIDWKVIGKRLIDIVKTTEKTLRMNSQ